ncbi:MAG: exopolysaccharide biosynthesis protein [bacterium]
MGNKQLDLKDKLNEVTGKLSGESVTLSLIMELIEQEALLVFCIFLTIPFMVPVSIPGVSTVFGAVIFLIGLSIMLNCPPLLPKRFMEKKFPADKLRAALHKGAVWVERLEKISHPRLSYLTTGTGMVHFNGLMIVLGAVLLMFPFGLVPLSNTLPGLAVMFLSIGILQKDGIYIMLGYITNIITIIYFMVLIITGAAVVREVSVKLMSIFPFIFNK